MSRATLIAALSRACERHNAILSSGSFNANPLGPVFMHVPDDLHIAACNLPELAELDRMLFNQGTMATTFTIPHLLQALVANAVERGVDQAIASMDRFLAADSNRCIDVLLLEGVSVSGSTEVAPGIFLCAPSSVPSSSLQKYLRFQSIPQPRPPLPLVPLFDREQQTPRSVLYTIREVRPKFFIESIGFPPVSETPAIYQIAEILTVAGPSSPLVFKSYSELADGEFMKDWVGSSLGRANNETRVFKSPELTIRQVDDFKGVVAKYLTLAPQVKMKLKVPLHRLNEAVKHQNNVDRALDLGIALESLLLAHQPSKEQLSLQFRLRGAWLLGKNGQHRAELFDTFNKLYSYRSFAAHSGAVAPTKTPEEEVKKTLEDGLALCAEAVCKIVEKGGFPEWNRLVVGADYMVDEEREHSDSEAE